MTTRTEAFIDGRFVPAADGRTFATVSPRDGTEIAQVARGDAEDVDRAVRAARRAFERGDWALADPAQRGRVLVRLAELMTEHLDELARLESADTGHPIGDARGVDVPNAARCLAWYGEAIDKVYGEIAPTAADALALIAREPLGVVGAVVPWNYPLIIAAWKLGPALAAGNSVVLKPAEQSPLSALRAGRAGRRGRRPGRRPQRGARVRRGGRGGGRAPSRRRQGRLHRLGAGGAAVPALRRRVQRQGGVARARRQEPSGGARRRRRSAGRGGGHRLGDLLQRRPDLPRGLARRGGARGPRRARRALGAVRGTRSSPATRWSPTPCSARSSPPSTSTASWAGCSAPPMPGHG